MGAWAAACTACCARPRRRPRRPRTALPRRPAFCCHQLPPDRLGRSARHSNSSRRRHLPDPRRRCPPPGCWLHSPRLSLRSRHQPRTVEMARRCCRPPPDRCPFCPRGLRVGRTPPISCRRWCFQSGTVTPFLRGRRKRVAPGVAIPWPAESVFSWEGPLLRLSERDAFPKGSPPLGFFLGGVLIVG
uniref:Uncharacterized protein n=1 Tax=Mus musculus TaxID=10090 RepID=Q3UTW2_MOUSE|nr:unnamed protein product [Mus musculus]